MKAACLVRIGAPLEIRDVDEPRLGPDDVILKIEAEGICRSDWHIWSGNYFAPGSEAETEKLELTFGTSGERSGEYVDLPIIMGHEFGAIVQEAGANVRNVGVGDRVTVPFHVACGTCAHCRAGFSNMCENGLNLGLTHPGGYGEYVQIPFADFNCIKVPDEIDLTTAAALGCRYSTAFRAVTTQGAVRPGEWLVVHGAGGVGMSAVQIGAAAGARVIAVDVDEQRLEEARRQGALATVNAASEDVPAAVRDITGGGAQVSLDALGLSTTMLNSIRGLGKRGRHVQVGLTTEEDRGFVALPVDWMTLNEIRFIGSVGNPHTNAPNLFGLVAANKLRPQDLIGRKIPLSQASTILEDLGHYSKAGFTVITSFE